MIVVIGKLVLQPGKAPQVEDALKVLLPRARADDGCISYHFARDVENADVLHSSERWRDKASLDAHNALPHLAAVQESAQPNLATAPDIAVYQVTES